MVHPLFAPNFLSTLHERVLLDVRSPGEYAQGHIPGAVCFPLFTDEERAKVGTLYKQVSAEAALLKGLEITGPKLADFVRQAARLAPHRKLAVHCLRGGQRSGSMAILLRTAGFNVVTLSGGYKTYRHLVLESFRDIQPAFVVLGGRTGSGKSKVLRALQSLGEQIIDLEALAHHKGSSFGSIGEQPQPTVEQFENDLHQAMQHLDATRPVWVENESRSIGRVYIPEDFWKHMKAGTLVNIEIPVEARLQNLIEDYAHCDTAVIQAAFERIGKRLGGQALIEALDAVEAGDAATAAGIALRYYDKTYQHCLDNNPTPRIHTLKFNTGEPVVIAEACKNLLYNQIDFR
jgi:tRNA 2-selenouridine synthase